MATHNKVDVDIMAELVAEMYASITRNDFEAVHIMIVECQHPALAVTLLTALIRRKAGLPHQLIHEMFKAMFNDDIAIDP